MHIMLMAVVAFVAATLAAAPAHADPITAAIVAAAGLTGFAASAATVALNLVIGVGLSFAASAFGQKKPKPGVGAEKQGTNISQKESISPRRLVYGRVRLGGTIVFLSSHQSNSWLYFTIALCEGPVDAIEFILLDDTYPTWTGDEFLSGPFKGYGRAYAQTGIAGTDTPPAFFTSRTDGLWTVDHRLDGVAALFCAFEWDSDGTYKAGLPNVSAVVRGLKVYDPRSGTTAYSNNAALVIRDYVLRSKEMGGLGLDASEIDEANFIAQANICDEVVTTADGTVPRYTINGIIELDGTTPGDVLDNMLSACGGRVTWVSGQLRLFVGAWRASTFTLTDDMIVGAPTVTTRVSLSQQYNAVKGTYRSAAARWEQTDFKAITSDVFEAEDNGERTFKDLSLPFTTDNATAQRLAKMDLFRAREPMEVTLPCNLMAYEVAVGDVIGVTHARWGWDAKSFEVVNRKWTVTDGEDGAAMGVELQLRETSAAAYSWFATDEQLLEANPETNLPNWNDPQPPTGLNVAEDLYETTASAGVKSRAVLSWLAADDGFVDSYQLEYRAAGSATWLALPPTSGLSAILPDIILGPYDFRVRSVNTLQAKSEWVYVSATITGLSAPPTTPTGLKLAPLNGFALLRWDRSPDLDVRIGGSMLVAYTPATTGVTWDSSVQIGDALPGDTTSLVVPLQAGTYLVRARDSSGVLSTSFASIAADQITWQPFTNLATVTESPGFSGTKTNCATDGTGLAITSVGSPAAYDFAGSMNLGSVKDFRLTLSARAATFSSGNFIDARTTLMDSWADFDGPTGGAAIVKAYYRTTQTNPSGSPTWSSWREFDVTDVRAWGVQFKVEFQAADPAWNVRILTLSVAADQAT